MHYFVHWSELRTETDGRSEAVSAALAPPRGRAACALRAGDAEGLGTHMSQRHNNKGAQSRRMAGVLSRIHQGCRIGAYTSLGLLCT